NCGYDLEVADAELAFKTAEDYSDPVADLELRRTEPELAPVTLELRRDAPAPERARAPRVARARKPAAVIAADDDDVWPARSTPVPVVAAPPAPAREAMFRIEPVRENVDQPEQETAIEPERYLEPEPTPEPVHEPEPSVAARVMPAPPERPSMPAVVAVPSVSAHPTTELPLFVRDSPAPPRAPLSVRRTVAEPPRVRTVDSGARPATMDLRVGPLDRDLLDDLRRVEREESAYAAVQARVRGNTDARAGADGELDDDPEDVPATQRLAAAALDGVLLGGIGTVALWATMRVTGASITSFGMDAIVAFLMFLSGVSVAYLLMFTAAGGQTVGKMLMGLRVVGDAVDAIDDHLTMPQAALRAVLAPLSVLALGLGWLPALFGSGLALHDRLAHTRVVRV
ncbi:MAG TPA: RDD family protein, partial [Vicinamibacterales bacterium]|nr:RDD family protein [Vicinamibacterales bacterium]